MRTAITLCFAVVFAALTAIAISQTPASATEPTQDRKAFCEAQKKGCLEAGTQTGTYGERYVPPDVLHQCYEQYRGCLGQN